VLPHGGQRRDVVPSPTSANDAEPLTRRALPLELSAAQEAERIVADARVRAKAIAAEAESRSESALEDAKHEGREADATALEGVWRRLRAAEVEAPKTLAAHEWAVRRELAERLLTEAIASQPPLLVDFAQEALASVTRARRAILYVNPLDAELLRQHLGDLGLDHATIHVQADSARPGCGLRSETDLGVLEADAAPQLDRLVAGLRR
jgi:flagellar biosynthesis/type III secretory pathway protein FliH